MKSEVADFKVALEDIVSWTGELQVTGTEYEGSGIAFEKGDVLFGKLRPYLAKAWLADRPGAAVGDLLVLRPEGGLTGRALRDFLLQRNTIDYLQSTAYGSKMPRTSWELVGGLMLRVAEPEQQRAIADFLDRETAEIDEFVAESEKLITLLNERRAAVITQAVTKGLDPTVPMKDTGIEWLGEIPAHWSTTQLRRVGRLVTGSTPSEVLDSRDEGAVGWVTPEDLDRHTKAARSVSLTHTESIRVVTDAVLVCCIGATIGKVGFNPGPISSNQQITALTETGFGHYWYYALSAASSEVVGRAPGNTLPIINNERLGSVPVASLPIREQRAIAAFLDSQTAKIDEAIEIAREAIALAKERRQALISAAVTGKIDVRGAA